MDRPALVRDASGSSRGSYGSQRRRENFTYEPLRVPNQEIRVLRLDPSQDLNAPLECTIQTWANRHQGRYRTLSYTWGKSGPIRSIYCKSSNGYANGYIGVTANLDRALRRLRAMYAYRAGRGSVESQSEWLWIDALCINQSDDEEKSVQVEQMSWTYRDSSATTIYLGDFENQKDADNVADFLEQNGGSTERISSTMDMTLAAKLNSLSALLQAPWFQRRWVIQETFQPRLEVTELMFNSITVPLLVFRNLLIATGKENEGGPIPLRPGLNEAATLRSLLELLNQFQESLCGDPRDRAYALLGISYEALLSKSRLKVDYRIEVSALFTNLGRIYADREEWLVPLLVSASCRNGVWKTLTTSSFYLNRNKPLLPTWVPDWDQTPAYTTPAHREACSWRNTHFCTLSAAGECQTSPPPPGLRRLAQPPICRLQTRARPAIVEKPNSLQLQVYGIVLLGCSGAVRLREQLWTMALELDPFSSRCRHGYSECVSSWLNSVSGSKGGARLKNIPRHLESHQALLLLEKRFSSEGIEEEGHNVTKAFILQTSDGGHAESSSTFYLHHAIDVDRKVARYITFPKRRWVTIA